MHPRLSASGRRCARRRLTPTKPMDTLRLLANVRSRAATNECQRLRNETTFMERKWEAESVGVGAVRPRPQTFILDEAS